MTRALVVALLLTVPALLSAADPVTAARAEVLAAEREQQRLEGLVAGARGTQARLAAEQAAAAGGIIAADARLSALRHEAMATQRQLETVQVRLATEQRPAALLLAGLTQYSQRPPLLALASGATVSDLVHLRALVETTLPVVQARTAGLRESLSAAQQLAEAAAQAEAAIRAEQRELRTRQQRFAALEAQIDRRLALTGGAALNASDAILAQTARTQTLAGQALVQQQARRAASALAVLSPPVPRPNPPSGSMPPPGLAWQWPLAGPILTGLGEVSDSGVRSRGLAVGSRPGAPVVMPAAGTVAYAGPFRRHLAVIVLDHGDGWMTLLTEVRTTLPRGTRLAAGDPLGRALGPVTVELSKDGRPQPAALIAGSSPLLSKGGQPS